MKKRNLVIGLTLTLMFATTIVSTGIMREPEEVKASLTAVDYKLTESITWYICKPQEAKNCDVHAQKPIELSAMDKQ